MAGDWIKIEHALPNKPEVMAMAESLDISEWEVVGHLVCFWTWVDQNMSAECPVVSGTKRGLDRLAGRTGFAEAMVGVGWLTLEDGKVKIPNYDDHLSQSAKSRSLEAKRKRLSRKKTGQRSGSVRDKNRTKGGTREEERREEFNKGSSAQVRPTLDDLATYCQERKNGIDPQRFLDHYESNGWKVGRTAMKDWRAAVRTWEQNGFDHKGKRRGKFNGIEEFANRKDEVCEDDGGAVQHDSQEIHG